MRNVPVPRAWGIEAELRYRVASENFNSWKSFRDFIFSYKFGAGKKHLIRCFWPYFNINCLGVNIGIGFYYQPNQVIQVDG